MRKAICAALLGATVLLAGACTPSSSTAFSVDGKVTTNNELDSWAAACAQAFDKTSSEMQTIVLGFLVNAQVAERIQAETGISFSDAERENLLRQSDTGRAMLRNPLCKEVGYGVAEYALLIDRMRITEFNAAQRRIAVVVNPRYGYWDSSSALVTGEGSLSGQAGDR
ncbi:MAG: hypothetical protein LBJ43_03495 [Propionibacteriaceae bacterium]|nr:hypothetical protein [Propionibacteriaceae bacterium]